MTAQGEDILAWLGRAITKSEQAAQAATEGPWVETGIGDFGWTVSAPSDVVADTADTSLGLCDATHIALNDPVSVLRRCAADRKLLELHQPVPDHGRYSEPECPADCDGQHDGPPVCMACRDYAGDPLQAPCHTLLALAEGYGWTEGER